MNLDWSAEDLAFREEVRTFLDENLTADLRRAGTLLTSVYAGPEMGLEWQRILHRRGWAAPAWPVEHGGCGWSASQRYIFTEELAEAGAPPLSPMGLDMCGPVLIGCGSPEQKARYLPRILSGDDVWCQGYSEPQAGSDLAALQMSAVEDGDDFVCSGHKLWTTFAHAANWIFCLVRTSREDIPQRGVTFVLIDMTTQGVEVRPIIMLTGEHIQNHVFFTDVRVPKAHVVGRIGEGWTVAKYLLEFERGAAVRSPGLRVRLRRLRHAAHEAAEPELLDRLAEASVELDTLEALELRALCRPAASERAATEPSMLKVLVTELGQRLTEIAVELAGVYSAPFQPHAACPGGPIPGFQPPPQNFIAGPEQSWTAAGRYFNDRAASIYAGTNEIQRNIMSRTIIRA